MGLFTKSIQPPKKLKGKIWRPPKSMLRGKSPIEAQLKQVLSNAELFEKRARMELKQGHFTSAGENTLIGFREAVKLYEKIYSKTTNKWKIAEKLRDISDRALRFASDVDNVLWRKLADPKLPKDVRKELERHRKAVVKYMKHFSKIKEKY